MSAVEPGRRILVELCARAVDPTPLELALELAARLDSELHALVVEDLALARSAALPFVLQINRLTGAEEAFDLARTERETRVALARLSADLERRATSQHVRWSLEVVRQDLARAAAQLARASDILIDPAPRASTSTAATLSVLRARRHRRLRGPVVLHASEAVAAAEPLLLAARLAGPGGQVVVLVPAAEVESLHVALDLVRERLPRDAPTPRLLPLAAPTRDVLRRALTSTRAGLLLVRRDDPLVSVPWLEPLLDELDLPLLLLSL